MPHSDPLSGAADLPSLFHPLVMGLGQAARALFPLAFPVLLLQGGVAVVSALWCISLRTGPRGPRAGV